MIVQPANNSAASVLVGRRGLGKPGFIAKRDGGTGTPADHGSPPIIRRHHDRLKIPRRVN